MTTVTWARAILQWQYGVDVDKIHWVAFQDSHLAEFEDPANVERIDINGSTLEEMLIEGVVDAAVLSRMPTDDRLRSLLPDPGAAAQEWFARFGAIQINHLFVVDAALSKERPDAVVAIYDMLKQAKQKSPKLEFGIDVLPFGVEANRENLEVAIKCAYDQKLIPRLFAVDDLFDETTQGLR